MGLAGATALGIPVLIMGDVVREEATRRNLVHSPKVLGKIMIELREKFGPAIIADRVVEKFSQLDSHCVVIDGARSEAEITRFRSAADSVVVIAVHAAPTVRFQRLVQRHREDDPLTWEAFIERDARELAIGIGRVIAQADIMLINEGDEEDAKRSILQLLKEQCELE